MRIITTVAEMAAFPVTCRTKGKTIALVPTMGYLHEGHLSLIRQARAKSDVVVASIFVNPTQFGPREDLDRYPRDIEGDTARLEQEGTDILFLPSNQEMYPAGYQTCVEVEQITKQLCGAHRPGHFRGVATIVTKLFNIISPHLAFFGQKDYQQTLAIKRLVQDLNMDVDIVVVPTVREPDGLAMSSRNAYLSPEDRKQALSLYKSLKCAENMFVAGERCSAALMKEMRRCFAGLPDVEVEYLACCNGTSLEYVENVAHGDVIALAVMVGGTRLIDNVVL